MEQIIVAMRGRNPDNPSDRRGGIELEQRLEPNQEGISNTLTTVEKDNLVLESESIPLNPMEDGTCRCLKNQYGKNSIPNFESQGTWGVQALFMSSRQQRKVQLHAELGGWRI